MGQVPKSARLIIEQVNLDDPISPSGQTIGAYLVGYKK
jgi:hypothetical protein